MYFKINIPEPCGENWHDMTPTEQGKFCASCEKEVIDFTNYTDSELASKLKNGEKLCGRFSTKQIDRDLFASSEKGKTPWKLIASFTTLMAMAGGAFGQEKDRKATQNHSTELHSEEFKIIKNSEPKIIDGHRIIEGLVSSDDGLPLPGATVILEGTEYITRTDFDGKYKLKIPVALIHDDSKLVFSFVGFETTQKTINESNQCNLNLHEEIFLEGEIVIIRHSRNHKKPRSRWMRFRHSKY